MPSIRVEESKYPDISITGRMGSGKTYMSDWLLRECGYTRMSFAAALKDIEMYLQNHSPLRTLIYMLLKYGDVPVRLWWKLFVILGTCSNMEIEKPKPRQRLQYLGNTIRDEISKDYWVNIAIRKYKALQAENFSIHVVFDDVRYSNEIRCLKSAGFITVKLETSPKVRLKRLKRNYGITSSRDFRLHAESEESCDDPQNVFDYTVINDDDNQSVEKFRDIIVNYILLQNIIDKRVLEIIDKDSKET